MTRPLLLAGGRALRAAVAVALLALGAAPWEAGGQQQTQRPREVARLKSVTGNVLVSREEGLAAGAQADRLVDGARVITTANSEAVIEFDDGCEVRLKENERFDVDSGRPCALMVAQALGVPQAAVGIPLATFILPGVSPAVLLDSGTPGTDAVSPN